MLDINIVLFILWAPSGRVLPKFSFEHRWRFFIYVFQVENGVLKLTSTFSQLLINVVIVGIYFSFNFPFSHF